MTKSANAALNASKLQRGMYEIIHGDTILYCTFASSSPELKPRLLEVGPPTSWLLWRLLVKC